MSNQIEGFIKGIILGGVAVQGAKARRQKRVVEFGEWLCIDVLKKVPHRHFVLSIPKIMN